MKNKRGFLYTARLGFSVIVFAVIAICFAEKHYYLDIPGKASIEIPKENYKRGNDEETKKFFKKTTDYNIVYGALGGGIAYIILSLLFRNEANKQ